MSTDAKPRNFGPKLREGETGPEKLCTICNEWWPADTEFFHADKGDPSGLFYRCRACYSDWLRVHRAAKRKPAADGAAA